MFRTEEENNFHNYCALNIDKYLSTYLLQNNIFFRGAAEWNQISNAVKPGGNFVVLGEYRLKIHIYSILRYNIE